MWRAELQGGKAIVEESGQEDASVSTHQPPGDLAKKGTNGMFSTASHSPCSLYANVFEDF